MRSRNKTDTTWSTPRTSSTSCTSPCPVDKQRHLTNKPTESNETPRGTRIFGSHLMTSYIIWEMTLISPSWKEFQKIDWICRQDSHSQHISVQYSLFKSAERSPRVWLKSSRLQCHLCASEKNLLSDITHGWKLLHLPLITSTSSSSFTLPSITRTRSTIDTKWSTPRTSSISRTSPSSPSQEAASSNPTALTLWDLAFEVFHSISNRTDGPKRESRRNPSTVVKPNINRPIPIKHTNVNPTNIDHIPSNSKNSDSNTILCVFEEIIKMMIKDESPLWVTLDRLFDRWITRFKFFTLTSVIKSQKLWQKEISHVKSGTIFFICSISVFSAPLVQQEFQIKKLLRNDDENTRAKRRRSCVQVATCSDESIFFHGDQFLLRIKSDYM